MSEFSQVAKDSIVANIEDIRRRLSLEALSDEKSCGDEGKNIRKNCLEINSNGSQQQNFTDELYCVWSARYGQNILYGRVHSCNY